MRPSAPARETGAVQRILFQGIDDLPVGDTLPLATATCHPGVRSKVSPKRPV